MAEHKDYEDLLRQYEPKQEPKAAPKTVPQKAQTQATPERRPVRPVAMDRTVEKAERRVPVQRSVNVPKAEDEEKGVPISSKPNPNKPSPPPLTSDKNNFKGGVYFSNPPKTTNKGAANNRGAQPDKGANNPNARRKANVQTKKKAPDNLFMRFLKSKGLMRFGIMLAVIAIVSTILCKYAIGCIDDVLRIGDETPVEVKIEQGMTDNEVIDLLAEKDLINNKLFCKLFIKIFEKDGPYITNTYTLHAGMGIEDMIALMKTDYTLGDIVTLTFPEGYTVQEIADKLEMNGVCKASAFVNALQAYDSFDDYDFIKQINSKDQRFRTLEGYLYPDTYDFYMGEDPNSVIKKFLNNFENKWTEEYQTKANELGMSIDEVITLASIIQMEAANSDQMPGVSSVIHNRLDNSYNFPKLECDSTTAYYTGTIAPRVNDSKKLEAYRNIYDTYDDDCTGLPVGAIANPGNAAISAALNPSDTGYYFFNHDVNGGIYYAVTAAEHDRNVAIAESVEPE